MEAAIVANGEILNYSQFQNRMKYFNFVIAVDNGLTHLDKIEVNPDILIGDFDSCPKDLLKKYHNIKKLEYPKDKDETDLELALEYCFSKLFTKATIFAAHGKRIDHLLGNIFAISRYKGRATIETESEIINFIHKKKTVKGIKGQTLSLIPICGPCKNIVTRGLKWNLNKQDLDQNFIGISNIAISDEVFISVESGSLLYVLQRAD